MSLPYQMMAQYEAIYEKHLEKMLAMYNDVDRAEIEAMTLFEEEVEQMEG